MAETLDALLRRAAGHPQTGLRFVDRRERARFVSWSAFADQAREVAASLHELGIAPKDRVALIFGTRPAFFRAFFGILLAGAVPVPLYPPVRLGRLDEYHQRTAHMLRAAGCRAVLAQANVRRLLGETIAAARPPLGCHTLEALPTPADGPARAGEHAATNVTADDLALIQFSSGTTTDPKPVALSHRALLAQVRALDDSWRNPDNPPTGVSWLPLYHDMGLIGCILPALELPSVMTLLPPEVFVTRPALWLRTLSRYRADISVAPNFAYALCMEKIRDEDLDGVDLSSWRLALCGAEPVSPAVLEAFRRRFARWGFPAEALTPVYGLSEAALAVTFGALGEPFAAVRWARAALTQGRAEAAAPEDDAVTLASVGKPLPGFDIRILAANGTTLPAHRVGRLSVRGPSLMDGYFGRADATAAVLEDGWLDTGDLGFVDQHGELYLTGRAKDVLILRGRNHDPAEVEQVASGVAGARPGCAVAVSTRRDEAATEALIVLVEHARRVRPDQVAALSGRVAEAVLAATGLSAERVAVLAPGSLPRTSSGKLRRGDALARYEAGELAPPAAVNLLTVGTAMVRSARAFRRAARARTLREEGTG